MGNNIVCSRCGSANVRCEAMVNPNTKGFDHFTDEAFYYGWCENCGLGVALTDKEEIRNEILEKYHRFKKENACELHIPADTRSAFPVISVQSPVSIQCCWQS